MKKNLLILLLFMAVSFCKAQHYTQFEPFDSTLTNGYFELTDCSNTLQNNITLDPALYTYVTGLRFYVVIDSVHFGGPMSVCPVQPGDTTFLDASHPQFSIIAISNLQVWYRLRLSGTPTVAGEIYPCAIWLSMCTCICQATDIQPSTTGITECVVDLYNSIAEANDPEPVITYPSPATNSFSVKNNSGKSTISLYNVYGQLVLKTEVYKENTIDISALPAGIYSLDMISGTKESFTKLVVAR